MKITVKDIARECGVSPGTVSRVLNDRTNVKETTRRKIQTAIKKLKYDPFQNLPLINNVKTRSIGLIIPSQAYNSPHPFNQRSIQAAQAAAGKLEYNTILLNEQDIVRKTGDEYHLGSKNIPCDALIAFCPHLCWDNYLAVLKNWGIPSILIRRRTKVAGIPMISDNDYAGIGLVMEHLRSLGHRRVAMYSQNPESGIANGRSDCFKDTLAAWGTPNPADYLFSIERHTDAALPAWIEQMRADGVTALVTGDDVLAAKLMQKLSAMGIRVPDDMAVTGYDNDYIAELLNPTLTTVNVPVEEMITMGVNMLAECLNGSPLGKAEIELDNRLVVRESTGKTRNA